MGKHIVLLTTIGSKEEAAIVSRGLVEEKLAYCVNIIPSIQSTYFWENKLCVDEELLLLIKTQEKNFAKVESWIRKNHSYDIPELIALPIVKGSNDYLECINNWVR